MEYITELITFLSKQLNNKELCLGFHQENPESALIILKDGLYLSGVVSRDGNLIRYYLKIPEEEYNKYEGLY